MTETNVAGPDRFDSPLGRWLGLVVPIALAMLAVTLVLLGIVNASRSAWGLLGAGRGLIPEEYYHVWGFVITLATTLGQAAGWAGGSGVAYYLMTLVGFRPTFFTAKLAMSVVYLGLGALPLSVYHGLYGGPLLGLSRQGLEEFLLAQYPDAYWLLFATHRTIDLSVIPLAVVFLGTLWLTGQLPKRSRLIQLILALALLGTSLAVALSLAVHSTLVHIRL